MEQKEGYVSLFENKINEKDIEGLRFAIDGKLQIDKTMLPEVGRRVADLGGSGFYGHGCHTTSQIAWQPIIVGIGCFLFPYLASIVTSVLEAGQSLIGELIAE